MDIKQYVLHRLWETSLLTFPYCLLNMCMQHCFSLSQSCLWFFHVVRCDPMPFGSGPPPHPPPPPDLDIISLRLLYPEVLCTLQLCSIRNQMCHGGLGGPRAA